MLLVLSLTGCPRGGGHDGDGRADVHVVTQTGIPAVGALFFVHAADGTLLETGETEDGEARVVVAGGEMVTAFYAFTTDIGLGLVSVYTIADVQQGDDLYFPVESFPATGTDRGEVTLTLSGTSMGGADGYGYALAGCPESTRSTFDPAGTEDTILPPECSGDAFEPYAFAGLQGPPIAFEVLPLTPLADLMSNGGAAFTGSWRTDFDVVAYSLTNIPPNAYSFVVNHRLYDADSRRLASNGAAALLLGLTSTSGELVAIPFATTDFTQVEVVANSTAGTLSLLRAGPSGDVSLDFATLPPYLGGATIAAVAGRLEVGWNGAPMDVDLLEIAANYGVAKNRYVGWRFRLPPDTAAPFRFPEWPPEIDGDAPPDSADLVDLGSVRFTDGEWVGWEDARTDDPRDDLETSDRRIVERRFD